MNIPRLGFPSGFRVGGSRFHGEGRRAPLAEHETKSIGFMVWMIGLAALADWGVA